jgi:hypothetical protein
VINEIGELSSGDNRANESPGRAMKEQGITDWSMAIGRIYHRKGFLVAFSGSSHVPQCQKSRVSWLHAEISMHMSLPCDMSGRMSEYVKP